MKTHYVLHKKLTNDLEQHEESFQKLRCPNGQLRQISLSSH